MESQAYPMLFSPIRVGTQEVKNRVFMPARLYVYHYGRYLTEHSFFLWSE